MSTSQDESIELIETGSTTSTKGLYKKQNKVGSPPHHQQEYVTTSFNRENDIFLAKSAFKKPQLPPVPAVRRSKKNGRSPLPTPTPRTGKTSSDALSSSLESSLDRRKYSEESSTKTDKVSDSKSYREKIKERYEMVKQQVKKSVAAATNGNGFRGKARNLANVRRGIELMREQNATIKNNLEVHERNRKLGSNDDISHIDMYNFFCENSNNLPKEIMKSTDEEINVSTEELIKDDDANDTLTVYALPEQLDMKLEIAENEIFWIPSRNEIPTEDKINEEGLCYSLEDGFYLREKPEMPTQKLNIIEQRLLNDDKKWFNCDGELEILENPYSKIPYRIIDSGTKKFTHYVNAEKNVDLNEPLMEVTIQRDNILDVYISTLKFTHHPLFSIEHVLEQKLIEHYDLHKQNISTNKIERIAKRLEALRLVKRQYEEIIDKSDSQKIHDKKYMTYLEEIKDLREMLYEELEKEKENVAQLLDIWKALKRVRKENKCANTAVKLIIRKERTNNEADRKNIAREVEEAVLEIQEEEEYKYKKALKKYKEDLKNWHDSKGDELKNFPKPKKPVFNSQEGLREEIEEKLLNKTSDLYFSIEYSNDITKNPDNEDERLRRNAVETTKIFLKFFYGKIEVCKSKLVPLNDHFTCGFDEAFAIKLRTVPESITIEIHEQSRTLFKRKLCQVLLNIPEGDSFTKLEELHFKAEDTVSYKHSGVGSNVKLNSLMQMGEDGEKLTTGGFITYNINWEKLGRLQSQDSEDVVDDEILDENGVIDVGKLKIWMEKSKLDPLDPRNTILFEYVKDCDRKSHPQDTTNKYFRCDPNTESLSFGEKKDLEQNMRFKFLQLRDRNEPEFSGMMVPSRLKEIPLNILTSYKKRINDENYAYILEDDFIDEVDGIRRKGLKFLKIVHTKVFQTCRCLDNHLEYEDVVNEKIISYFESYVKTVTSNFFNWFRLQPNANKPLPKLMEEEKKSDVETLMNPKVTILIRVVSIMNLPERLKTDVKDKEPLCFVRVDFQNMSAKTEVKKGLNPKFNEELIISLETTNCDYLSPNALDGSITINIFDEVQSDDGNVDKWLGFVKIPLSAVVHNEKIEGLFKVYTPQLLYGYGQEIEKYQTNSARMSNIKPVPANYTYVNLKITMKPSVPKMHPNLEDLECGEPAYLRDHIIQWNDSHNFNFPQRKFSALAIEVNCKTTCITRFIRPLEPPKLNLEGFDVTPEQCARYISLIPITDCNVVYQNVWLSTNQFLKIMIGSVIDHAVALTCFLVSLKLEVWLLLGCGIPHGSTAYVLIREYNRDSNEPLHFIYDVMTGCKYNVLDPFSPLQRIYCVVTENNVWANVQRTDVILNTRFDFSRRSDWLPLFDNAVSAPTNSLQEKLVHRVTEPVQELEMRIERKVMHKIAKARKYTRTIWNTRLASVIKKFLYKFEYSIMYEKQSVGMDEMRNLLPGFSVDGFVMCFPYTNVKAIVEFMVNTGSSYLNKDVSEFIFAVHVHCYSNQVLGVWIAFGSLIRND